MLIRGDGPIEIVGGDPDGAFDVLALEDEIDRLEALLIPHARALFGPDYRSRVDPRWVAGDLAEACESIGDWSTEAILDFLWGYCPESLERDRDARHD